MSIVSKDKIKKILLKLTVILAICQLLVPTSLTAITVLAEQIGTETVSSGNDKLQDSDLDFEKAMTESGDVLKDASKTWLLLTYNKIEKDLPSQDLFLTLPAGMTVDTVTKDKPLNLQNLSVPSQLAIDEGEETINNTDIISGFKQISESVYKISFKPTTQVVNLVFQVTNHVSDAAVDLQLSDKQDVTQALLKKTLTLTSDLKDEETALSSASSNTIQPRAIQSSPSTGNQDISNSLTLANQQLTLVDKDKNGIYNVGAPDSLSFKADLSLLDQRLIVAGNYFNLKISDSIHYNMLNPTDINFPVLKQDGKVIAVPELTQDGPVDGLLRATGKTVRYSFTDQVSGLTNLNLKLDLEHSVNPNVVQMNGKHDFSYQIGQQIIKQNYDVLYAKPKENDELNIHQRLTYTDSKQNLKASSLIYVNPKQIAQAAGRQALTIDVAPKTYNVGGKLATNLLNLNSQTDIKVYKLRNPKGITDAVNLDKQYWEEVKGLSITKGNNKIDIAFDYKQAENTAYAVEVITTLNHEGGQPLLIAQRSSLQALTKSISEIDSIATVGSGGSAIGDQSPKGTLYLNKVDSKNLHLANATFTLSGTTTAGQFLYRTLVTDTKEVAISDLPTGTYQLKETAAPSTYVRVESPWTVTVDSSGKVSISGNDADTKKTQEAADIVILWEATKWHYGSSQFYQDRIKEFVDAIGNPNARYTVVGYGGDTSVKAQILLQSVTESELKSAINKISLATSLPDSRNSMLNAYNLALQHFQESKVKQKYLLQLTEYPIYHNEKTLVPNSQATMDSMKSIGVIPYLLIARDPTQSRSSYYLNPVEPSPSFGGLFAKDNIKVAWSKYTTTLFQPDSSDDSYTNQIQAIGSAIKQAIPTSVLTITNKQGGQFSLKKIDENKNDLAGATFTLSKRTTVSSAYQVQGDFPSVSQVTSFNRTTLTFDHLKPGVYNLRESKAPEAYAKEDKTYVVVVQNSGKTTIIDEASFKETDFSMADASTPTEYPTKEIENKPNHIQFFKVGDKGKELAGAEFALKKDNQTIQTVKSGSDGSFAFTKLKAGNYELWETKVADSAYQLPKEAVATFNVTDDGVISEPIGRLFIQNAQKSNRYEIRNKLINKTIGDQKIKVIKRDELTDLPLANTQFQLEASDGTIYLGLTDSKGEYTFDKLPYGQYVLTEIEAPDGYILDRTPRKINITEASGSETEVVASSPAGTQPAPANTENGGVALTPTVTGKDVSDKITIKKLKITSSNDETPTIVKPNSGENIVIRAEFTIQAGSGIKAGDTFTVTLPNTIDPFGVSVPENVAFRVMGPHGTLALGSYDSTTRTITYTFTDYITRYAVSTFSMISPFFIDRHAVKYSRNIDIYFKIGNQSSQPQTFAINYDPYYGVLDTHNPVNIGSMITSLDEATGDFVEYIYVNPLGKSLELSSLTLRGNGSTIFNQDTNVQVFGVIDRNLQMPPSWGIDERMLREIDYLITKEDGKISINFDNDLLLGKSYIIKVSGKSDLNNSDPIHTEAVLQQHYFNDYPYWTQSGRYIPYGPYTESFKFTSGVIKKSGESNADGSIVVNLTNRKNYIDFTKTDAHGNPLEATFELRRKSGSSDTVTVGSQVNSDKTTGKFYFEGLAMGDYEVWETKAPDGYVKPVKAVATFRINDEGEVVEKSLEDGRIINYKRPELPATGGMGWIVYMIMGSAICFIAIFWNQPFRFKK